MNIHVRGLLYTICFALMAYGIGGMKWAAISVIGCSLAMIAATGSKEKTQ